MLFGLSANCCQNHSLYIIATILILSRSSFEFQLFRTDMEVRNLYPHRRSCKLIFGRRNFTFSSGLYKNSTMQTYFIFSWHFHFEYLQKVWKIHQSSWLQKCSWARRNKRQASSKKCLYFIFCRCARQLTFIYSWDVQYFHKARFDHICYTPLPM